VPAVAREVGLTPSAVYAYFPSKQALFEAALDADAASLVGEALPDLLVGEFDGDFAGVFSRLLAALPGHPLARRVLAGVEETGVERLVHLPSEKRLLAGIDTAIRRGQAEGRVRTDIDPATIAAGLEAIVVALLASMLQIGPAIADAATTFGVIAVLEAAVLPPAET
jgi:AcrR family transcriptional regulator